MTEHPRDEGLARERTILAWSRTGLAMIAVGAAVVKTFPTIREQSAHRALGAAMIVLGAAVWLLGATQYRVTKALPHVRERARGLRLVSLGTATVAVCAFVLALFPRSG